MHHEWEDSGEIGPRNVTIGKFQVTHGVERDRNLQSRGSSASKVEFGAKNCVLIFSCLKSERVRAKIGPRNVTIGKFQVAHGFERDGNLHIGGFSASGVEFDAKVRVLVFSRITSGRSRAKSDREA